METAFIIYNRQKTFFDVPSDWTVLTNARFIEPAQEPDVTGLTEKALRNPIGAPPLEDCLSPSRKVAVIVEDITRASPKGLIMETLLSRLEAIGTGPQDISVVISLGTHRPMTAEELEETFGRDLIDRFEFINHDCRATDLVPVGRLKTGGTVRINRRVHEADFKIGVGSVFPHPMNGFGGGGKILFPGVSDFDSILEHHLNYKFQKGSDLGRIDGNPFHEEVSAIARSAKLNFILNAVLDQSDRVAGMVAGDPFEAHHEGIRKCREINCRPFPGKADVTVITAFPYDEGPQIMKPLAPASMVTKEGGCIILAVNVAGNLPDAFVETFERFHSAYGSRLQDAVHEHFGTGRLIMEGGAIDFNMALAMALTTQHRFKIILVTEDLSRDTVERMGFRFARDLETAFSLSAEMFPNPEVHIIPSGGVILPVLG